MRFKDTVFQRSSWNHERPLRKVCKDFYDEYQNSACEISVICAVMLFQRESAKFFRNTRRVHFKEVHRTKLQKDIY